MPEPGDIETPTPTPKKEINRTGTYRPLGKLEVRALRQNAQQFMTDIAMEERPAESERANAWFEKPAERTRPPIELTYHRRYKFFAVVVPSCYLPKSTLPLLVFTRGFFGRVFAFLNEDSFGREGKILNADTGKFVHKMFLSPDNLEKLEPVSEDPFKAAEGEEGADEDKEGGVSAGGLRAGVDDDGPDPEGLVPRLVSMSVVPKEETSGAAVQEAPETK